MNVFLDTNVLIDILVRRDDESLNRDSVQAVSNALFLGMDLKACAVSFATLNYILKKLPPAARKEKITKLIQATGLEVLPATEGQVKAALEGKFDDLEDAMQNACAQDNGCEIILTRNVSDFRESDLCIFSPKEFVRQTSPLEP